MQHSHVILMLILHNNLNDKCNIIMQSYANAHIIIAFYSARNARIASAVLATAIPSVRLSHAGTGSKRRHVARCSLHRWIEKCV